MCGGLLFAITYANYLFTHAHTHTHSLALHPEKNLVATGQIGKDPFVCVWDSTTLETVSILQGGHERGITAVAFNKEGNVRSSICIASSLH